MKCRVGMGTDPDERIHHWMNKEGHSECVILHEELTYEEALDLEKEEAEAHGCTHSGGGQRVPGRVWSVYMVWH